jgi:hypothetical protein
MTARTSPEAGILQWRRSLFFASAIPSLAVMVFVAAACGLILFAWLQLHNQAQTEYLIFSDYWRNYAAWKNDQLFRFFFHNVHTWAVITAVWFLDVLVAAGNLKLLHAYVVAANVLAFCSVFFILRRGDADGLAPLSVTFVPVLAAAAMWLSPSNSTSFIYPCVDVLASTTLLMIGLSEILYRWNEDSGFTSPKRLIVYALASLLGFLTLETFLCVPLFYGLDSRIRGRSRGFISAMLVFAALLSSYVFCVAIGLVRGVHAVGAPLVIAHNFLVLLSSHFGFLLSEAGLSQKTVSELSICLSLIQISCLICFATFHYLQPKQRPSVRFTLVLALFALTAVALATLLRFGDQLDYSPLDRYTWYSELFSIAVFLQATDLWLTGRKNRVRETASIIVVTMCVAYLFAEEAALLLRSHNIGTPILFLRLEMAVYATAPGNEQTLGPTDELHEFLQNRRLSVFRGAGYESLGTRVADIPEPASHPTCIRRADVPSLRRDMTLHFMSFNGVEDDGMFVVADRTNIVTGFSFAERTTPFDGTVTALLPGGGAEEGAVYFVKLRPGQELGPGKEMAAIRCR